MEKNRNKINIFAVVTLYYLPLLLWMGLIFYFSSLEGPGNVGEKDFWFYFERKGAHVIEFFILAILFYRIVSLHIKQKAQRIYWTIFLSILYAIFDEIHQIFVVGREGKISDIGFDVIGIILALILVKILTKK